MMLGRRIFGILVAAGMGMRMGFKKQFALLAGKPIWERSGDALTAGGVERIWLVVPSDDVDAVRRHLDGEGRSDVYTVVAGGATRAESVGHGVQAILSEWEGRLEDVIVAVHDAVRPFVTPEDVRRVVEAATGCGGAVLGQPCVDTLKRVDSDLRIVGTVPRAGLWQAQTPQAFALDVLARAYADASILERATDDAMLVESLGLPVQMVRVSGVNVKITTPADLEFAQWLAERRWGDQRDAHGDRV
jgi:2-C-methyl-D-erythritol 4-phosphate cytidylyltransferase